MPWSADHDLEMDSCAANIVENQASPNPPPFFCAFPHLRSRQTHYFVTSSKDGTIKFWDGDTFDHVLTLEGHFAPVWGLAVATDGDFVVTASQVLRVGCRARVRARMRLCTLKVCRCMYISVWPNAASIHSRVATLLPSPSGRRQDRSIRTWLRTEEQLFLEEERELRLDSMFELPVLQQARGHRWRRCV